MKSLDPDLHENDKKRQFLTFYKTIKIRGGMEFIFCRGSVHAARIAAEKPVSGTILETDSV